MICFQYKEIPLDPDNDLTMILNNEGADGWEFMMITQKPKPQNVFTTNVQRPPDLFIMLKRQYQSVTQKAN